ncbi:hypothetical protein LTR84_011009 [Exophiala bonariae]|uniref:Uncharacterized protein n=1 Tax=Exophiala bonariae TaxID=1690606 RepID=A0AAV9NI10_9EURO|nr:hypothetical protein LTR84_011009 [Exophiala bonariae]
MSPSTQFICRSSRADPAQRSGAGAKGGLQGYIFLIAGSKPEAKIQQIGTSHESQPLGYTWKKRKFHISSWKGREYLIKDVH